MKIRLLYLLNIILIFLIIIILLYFIYLKIKKKYIKELFSNDKRYIITLSTIPANFDTSLPITLNSLLKLNNFDKIEKIIINIPNKYSFRFNNETISQDKINKFKEKYKNTKIYLNIVDNDYGPGTKLVGALKNLIKFEDDNLYVIIIDDDKFYHHNILDIIEYNHKINDKFVLASGHYYKLNNIKIGQATDMFYIKSNLLKDFMDYFNKIKNLDYILYHDDVYISYFFYLKKINFSEIKNLENNKTFIQQSLGELSRTKTQLHKIEGKYNRKELNKRVIDVLENHFKKR